MQRIAALAWLSAALLIACPRRNVEPPRATLRIPLADAGENRSPTADLSSPDEYWRIATPLVCKRALRCGTIGASELDACLKGRAQSRLTLVWGSPDLLGLEAEAQRGRYRFDASSTGRCVNALASAECHVDYRSLPAHCLMPAIPVYYTPAVAAGGRCSRWDECIDGFCPSQPGCESACVARSAVGETCGSNQLCTEHAFCDNGRCVPRGKEGEACLGHWQACEEPLFCDGYQRAIDDGHYESPERPGRCAKPRREGEPCSTQSSSELCAGDFYCDWGADTPICRSRLRRGMECRWLDACADGLACIGLVLAGRNRNGPRLAVSASGRCQPFLDAGQSCDPAASVTGCPATMTCDRTHRRCRSSGLEGDVCESSWCPPNTKDCHREGCVISLYCNQSSRTCQRRRRIGESCVPAELGVEDEPCFYGECDRATRRCVPKCDRR